MKNIPRGAPLVAILFFLQPPCAFASDGGIWKCDNPNFERPELTDVEKPGCKKVLLPPDRPTPAPKSGINLIGFSEMSCGDWAFSAHSQARRAQYLAWFRGFATGVNYASPERQIPYGNFPDDGSLILYLDKYCRENPLRTVLSAAFPLVRALQPAKISRK